MAQEFYEIRVKGHLDLQLWSNWLEGLTLTHAGNGETILSGFLADQSALHGVLHKLEAQVVPLIAVNRVPADEMPPSE